MLLLDLVALILPWLDQAAVEYNERPGNARTRRFGSRRRRTQRAVKPSIVIS